MLLKFHIWQFHITHYKHCWRLCYFSTQSPVLETVFFHLQKTACISSWWELPSFLCSHWCMTFCSVLLVSYTVIWKVDQVKFLCCKARTLAWRSHLCISRQCHRAIFLTFSFAKNLRKPTILNSKYSIREVHNNRNNKHLSHPKRVDSSLDGPLLNFFFHGYVMWSYSITCHLGFGSKWQT